MAGGAITATVMSITMVVVTTAEAGVITITTVIVITFLDKVGVGQGQMLFHPLILVAGVQVPDTMNPQVRVQAVLR